MIPVVGHVVPMAGGNIHPTTCVVALCAGRGGRPSLALGALIQRAWPNQGVQATAYSVRCAPAPSRA